MSGIFTFIGFGASIVFFVAALIVIGWLSSITGEKLIGGVFIEYSFSAAFKVCFCLWFFLIYTAPGLLFILSRLHQSSLPAILNKNVDDQSALDEQRLQQFSALVKVHISHDGQLDFVGLNIKGGHSYNPV